MSKIKPKLKQRKYRDGLATKLDRIEKLILSLSKFVANLHKQLDFNPVDLTAAKVHTVKDLRKALRK